MTEDQWKDLLFTIRKGKCVLLLGAGTSTLTQHEVTRPLTEWLALSLAEQLKAYGHQIEESESGSLLYVATEYLHHFKSTVTLLREVENFYKKFAKQPNELMNLVAELPIPLIVNTAPDSLLEKSWLRLGKAYHKSHYSLHKDRERENADLQLEDPTSEKPLLYNLFGDVEDSASLILTEKDRLNFIEDIIQHNNAIPNAILKHFKDDKDKIILFLGFDFEQWHLRILPKKIFQKEEINAPIFVPYGDKEITKNAMVFYNRQYKMEFLQDEPLEFVKELVDRLDKQDETTEMIAANAPIRVVYLYDQSDSSLLTTLKKHMSSLSCKDAIDSWDDSMILAGEVEGDQITQKLAQANLIILLVSSDFLSSERLYKVQLLEALKRYREGKAFIIPILVRSCAWEGSVFSKSMFILPRNQVPITSWEDQDAAYRNVVIELEKYIPHLVENLQA